MAICLTDFLGLATINMYYYYYYYYPGFVDDETRDLPSIFQISVNTGCCRRIEFQM